jgi:hypothetical protein
LRLGAHRAGALRVPRNPAMRSAQLRHSFPQRSETIERQ